APPEIESVFAAPSDAVIRLYGWKYEPFGPAGVRPSRSKRDAMNSAATALVTVSVKRPCIASEARNVRSARSSSFLIDSIFGAPCCACTMPEARPTRMSARSVVECVMSVLQTSTGHDSTAGPRDSGWRVWLQYGGHSDAGRARAKKRMMWIALTYRIGAP